MAAQKNIRDREHQKHLDDQPDSAPTFDRAMKVLVHIATIVRQIVETLITLMIMGIIPSCGSPSFHEWYACSRLAIQASQNKAILGNQASFQE